MTQSSTRTLSLRTLAAALSLSAVAGLTACDTRRVNEVGTGPALPEVSEALVTPPQLATILKRTVPLARDYSKSVVVGPTGGSINIPEAGFHLNIPKASLYGSKPITITVTALAGDEVAYTFSPHGLKFTKAISATQDLEFTTWNGNEGKTALEAAYFADDSLLNLVEGTATIGEVFPTNVNATGQRVHWGIPHFSGYIIATGRRTAY